MNFMVLLNNEKSWYYQFDDEFDSCGFLNICINSLIMRITELERNEIRIRINQDLCCVCIWAFKL